MGDVVFRRINGRVVPIKKKESETAKKVKEHAKVAAKAVIATAALLGSNVAAHKAGKFFFRQAEYQFVKARSARFLASAAFKVGINDEVLIQNTVRHLAKGQRYRKAANISFKIADVLGRQVLKRAIL